MIVWKGLQEFEARLGTVVTFVDEAARQSVAEIAGKLEELAKNRASGRPGPEVITGHLRGGIKVAPIVRVTGHKWGTEVGPTMIYSRRVELGFNGTDALGRTYRQPGYPYFIPAYVEVSVLALGIFQERVGAVLRIA